MVHWSSCGFNWINSKFGWPVHTYSGFALATVFELLWTHISLAVEIKIMKNKCFALYVLQKMLKISFEILFFFLKISKLTKVIRSYNLKKKKKIATRYVWKHFLNIWKDSTFKEYRLKKKKGKANFYDVLSWIMSHVYIISSHSHTNNFNY